MPITLDELKLSDEPNQIRTKWKEIKGRYKEVMRAKNVVFGEGMGPLLDKRAAQWKKIEAWQDRKLPRVALVTAIGKAKVKSELNTLVTNGTALETTARGYLGAIANLGNPAQAELTKALNAIIDDAEHDQSVGRALLQDLAR